MKYRIEQKASELFMRYGFNAITMDEIASHLGTSKKTIYQYFTNKKALVNVIVENQLKVLQNDVEILQNTYDPVNEVLHNLESVEMLLNTMNPHFLFEMEKSYPEAYKKFLQYKNGFFFNAIKDNLERGIAGGIYREGINIEILSLYRMESIFIAFEQNIFPATKFHLYKVMEEIALNFLYGIVTIKGKKLIENFIAKQENLQHS
ncbi:MAG: TetR/AcrR family transcriptional regulator [Bacteroidetes bacterium]|nr:TetR/AcrR family transcriptional regulator [Bacteroidota bacterium]